MALPNPIYIDQQALHKPSAIRLLAYATTTGVQGVVGVGDCAIRALAAPGPQVQAMPGAYMVRGKHLGGSYEGYAGKFDVAELSPTISNTTSSGGRTDLVVLIIKNPYVSGSGSWPTPTGQAAVDGPYAFIDVIEGVTNTTWDVAQYNDTWSAITLARIDRPANSTQVVQSHITDLRSIAALGGTRTVIKENPPVTLPPIAQESYTQFRDSAADPNYGKPTGGSDNVHDYFTADTVARSWPTAAYWPVAVPTWATECDAEAVIYNAQILTGDVYGKLWLDFGGITATTPGTYAIDYYNSPARHNIGYGSTFKVPQALRGKIIAVKMKFQSYYPAPGKLDAKSGTTTKLALNWQRSPDYVGL